MHRILGLDQSSNVTGWCLSEDDHPVEYGIIKVTSGWPVAKRISSLKSQLNELVDRVEPNTIILEDIQCQKLNIVGYKTLAMVLGVLENYLFERGIEYHIVSPSQWRKRYGFNKGKKKKRAELKALAIEYVKENFNIEATEDECEAILISLYRGTDE